MTQQGMSLKVSSFCLLLGLCCLTQSAAAARTLKTLGGDVNSETKVNADINGGVPPLYQRVEKVLKKDELKHKLLLAEAECKAIHDLACPEVVAIKEQTAAQAAANGEGGGETVEAPCYQSIIGSYFLGTLCTLPPDSKADGNDRPADSGAAAGRRLLSALKWW